MQRVSHVAVEISERDLGVISLELAPPEPREEQRLLHHVLVRLANLPGEARVGDRRQLIS